MAGKLTVSLVYRNYKPLHSAYVSLIRTPPAGVQIIAPEPKSGLGQGSLLFKMYRKFGRNRLAQTIIKYVDSWFFSKPSGLEDQTIDLYHYINMVPNETLDKPYVIELEHAGALFSFVFDKRREQTVKAGLKHAGCRAIICSSHAAERTLKELFNDDYDSISRKVHVVYPAIDRELGKLEIPTGLAAGKSLRLLFVGNDAYRKGLEEVLLALQSLGETNFKLTVISSDAGPIVNKYPALKNVVELLPSRYSKQQIIKDFYSKSDLLLLLTKQDTFGFAALDAMSSGVPVLATKQFALPEIVTDGRDGVLLSLTRSVLDEGVYYSPELAKQVNQSNVDEKVAKELIGVLADLDQNRQKIVDMGKQALNKFKTGGRFSVQTRNKQLMKIYQAAVNGKID
jgi:glycosyltransferase involved in cell wall biosynthesis